MLGCINKYYNDVNLGYGDSNLTSTKIVINTYQVLFRTTFKSRTDRSYATTFNCMRSGGQRITIVGSNFGTADASVTVAGRPCTNVVHVQPQTIVQCTLPPGLGKDVSVTVVNGELPGLSDTVKFLSYAVPPPPPLRPLLSNIAARSIDISWNPPVDYWEAVTITGYKIGRRISRPAVAGVTSTGFGDWIILGNVTTTTALGLSPDTPYEFVIAAMTEDQLSSSDWLLLDLYGRRDVVPGGCVH